jgi:TATA-box binding protein (TBP) (component of TFIID and TFIIIB)
MNVQVADGYNLKKLAYRLHVQQRSNFANPLHFKMRNPDTTVLFFPSSNLMLCVKSETADWAIHAFWYVARKLTEIGYFVRPPTVVDITTYNICYNGRIGHYVDAKRFDADHANATLRPKKINSVRYPIPNKGKMQLVFYSNGKYNVMGSNKHSDFAEVMPMVERKLAKYRDRTKKTKGKRPLSDIERVASERSSSPEEARAIKKMACELKDRANPILFRPPRRVDM